MYLIERIRYNIMNKNEQIAIDVLNAVGGKENVSFVTHCMTRLRFNLKDQGIVDDKEVESLDGVIGVATSGGQYQVIIGQNVPKVYKEICDLTGIATSEAIEENLDAPKEKLTLKKIGQNILSYLAGSMTPLIPAMITAAMFKTVQVVVGPDFLNLISTESDVYLLCDFLYNAFFYFLPIFLGYTAAKKLNISPVMGLFMSAVLLVPGFVALAESETKFLVYGFIPTTVYNYSQTILPAILSIWVMSYVYKFFEKIIPDVLSTVFTPFVTMIVMVPVSLCVLAPMGSILGKYIADGLWAFGDFGGFLALAIVAGLWEFLVMSGMHQVLIVFALSAMMQNGSDTFVLTASTFATWAAMGMAFGAFLRIKKKEEKSLALGYFISAVLGGVTEPVLYGIGFKYKKPFIALFIGGFLGGLYAGITHVSFHVLGSANILMFLTYVAGGTGNIINAAIGASIAFIVTAILTYKIGFSNQTEV